LKKQQIGSFFLIMIIGITFLCCDAMAELFHGEKPSVTYTVTFNANGADGTAPAVQTVNEGAVISLPDKGSLTSTGNVFTGWNENANGTGTTYSVGASVTVTRNIVFYAQWLDGSTPQYTVTFHANGATSGAAPASQTVYRGSSITVPGQGTLAYSGKNFGGWNTQANGGGTNYAVGAAYTVTGNVTLYAKWQSEIQYTVTYNANGASGTAPSVQTVDKGTVITLPGAGDMTNTGKKFVGWTTQASGSGTSYVEGAAYTVNGNVTFYAQWQSPYTVTYNANGASGTEPAAQTVDPGTEITLPGVGDMTYTGKKFTGWNTQANGNGTSYAEGAAYTVNGNITFYAKWQDFYIVTFNANGANGTVPEEQTVNSGAVIILPNEGSLSSAGNVFVGWNESSSGGGTTYSVGASITVTRNIVFYAQWLDSSTPQYTVTFNANGATSGAAPASQTVYRGISITVPGQGTLDCSGKMFDGWNTQADGSGTNYMEGTSYTVNADILLYAKWVNKPIEVPGTTLAAKLSWLNSNAESYNTYLITMNYNEGIGPTTLSYSNKSNITLIIRNTVMRTISLSSNGTLFTVGSGVTLILDNNITLQGRSDNSGRLVSIYDNGTLIINTGVKIIGNTVSQSFYGGGISINGGTVIMSGGEISGNTVSAIYSNYASRGGGVYMTGGTFTMNGGEISNNSVYYQGGGIYMSGGIFTKNGGTIYGANGGNKSNTVKNGSSSTLLSYSGHAIYAGGNSVKRMENTIGPEVYLYYNYNNGSPIWSGDWEY